MTRGFPHGFSHDLPRFRADLEILKRPGKPGEPTVFYVRDPRTQDLFELGEEGVFICGKLDGKTDPREIGRLFQEEFGTPLSPEDLGIYLRQLAESGLLEGIDARPRRRTFAEYLDPEVFLPWFAIRLGTGDRLLGFAARQVRFLFTWPVHVLSGVALFCCLWIFLLHGLDLLGSLSAHLTFGLLVVQIAASCLAVHSPRMLLHGIMCKRYGRQVSEIGIAFLYYALPVVYCNWSDTVWIRDEKKRFWAIASGLYYHIVLWSVSTIGWWLTRPGSRANLTWLALSFSAALGLFLFNINPLVKMNAYLLLVNKIRVPRLRERALAAFGTWMTFRQPVEVYTAREKKWFILYGGMVFLYAIFHLGFIWYFFWGHLTIKYAAPGVVGALALMLFMVHKIIIEILAHTPPVRWLFQKNGGPVRWMVRLGAPACLIAAVFLPYPYQTGGPVRLLPSQRVEVRSDVEGLVEEVLVREGQWVEAGQPVARLSGRALERNLRMAEARLDAARAQLALLRSGVRPEQVELAEADLTRAQSALRWSRPRAERFVALYRDEGILSRQDYEDASHVRDLDVRKVEEALASLDLVKSGTRPEQIEGMEAQARGLEAVVDGYRRDLARTTLMSPIAGRVVTPHVEEWAGAYVQPDVRNLAIQIDDARTIQAEIQLPEEDLSGVHIGSPVSVVCRSLHDVTFRGRVAGIAPIATPFSPETRNLTLQGLADGTGDALLLNAPGKAVRVIMLIPNPDGLLKSEMTGYAKIATEARPLWRVLLGPLLRWLKVEVWSWLP